MIQAKLSRADGLDIWPDHLDLEALPPLGTRVYIDGTEYLVAGITLRVRPWAEGTWRSYYQINLRGPY